MRRLITLILLVAALPVSAQKRVNLVVLHTNDTHGHLLPYSYPETYDPDSDLAKLESRHDIGGAARRATLIDRVRHEKGHETLLIDAGDICDGTPFSTEYHGDADMAVMNALHYDLACPGNHEFSNTLPQVRKLIAAAKFPYLCANVYQRADGKPLYTPYIVKQVGSAKVAFFGLLTYDARTYKAAKDDLQMAEPVEVAKHLVPDLRRQADLVIAITHIGVKEDEKLATEVRGIDAIIGGHSHTLLPQPLFAVTRGTTSVPIVQDFQWAGTLGRLDLTLEQRGSHWIVSRAEGRLLPVDSSVPSNGKVARLIEGYWKPIAPKYGEVVGSALGDFSHKGPDRAEYNLVADAVRESLGLEFDIENIGGVRAPLIKGPITYGDMITLDPFGNTIVTFQATGRQLKEILVKLRPAVSGIRYELDGDRLLSASVGGKPIDDERLYRGATNSFMAAGPVFRDLPGKTDTKQPRLDVVLRYIRNKKAIAPLYDARRVVRNVREQD